MRIVYEEHKHFKYAFEFDFNPQIVEVLREIQNTYTWKEFYWLDKKWRFTNPGVYTMLRTRFPTSEVDPLVTEDLKRINQKVIDLNKIKEEAQRIKNSEVSSIGNIEGINADLREYQKIGVEFFANNGGRGILADDMGTGKAQAIGTPVLTPSGWRKIGDLKIGDEVFHPTGKKQIVIGVFPQGKKEIFDVTFSDGSKTNCCIDHLWDVRTSNSKVFKTMSLYEIINRENKKDKLFIPMASGEFEFELKDFDTDFRKKKLENLLETSGYVNYETNLIECILESEEFALDIKFIVQLLGGTASIQERNNKYIISMCLPESITTFSDCIKQTPSRYITNIKSTRKEEEAVCIKVNEDDGLYVTEEFIVTHNTLQSISYLVHKKVKLALVICPASLKYNWESEVLKFSKLKSYVMTSKSKIEDVPNDVNVVIINYDILKKHLKMLLQVDWECIIADEAHFVKNAKAERSKCANLLASEVPSVILLTGTPLLSRPIELFHLLHMIDPDEWTSYYSFADKYANGHMGKFGYNDRGASNIDELRSRISGYYLRRTKSEVLKELPPIILTEIPVPFEGKFKTEYKKAQDEFAKYLLENKNKSKGQVFKTLKAEKLAKINYLREILSRGKIGTAKEMAESIIEQGEKVLLFCSFNEPLKQLKEHFGDKAVMIISKVSDIERQKIVERFQADPEVKVFLGGYKSAGLGLTLTAGNNSIMIDYPWNPGDFNQARDRVHRMGQKAEVVNIYQLHTKGSLDDYMKKTLEKKQMISDVLIDSEDMEDEIVEELIQLIEAENNY